MSNERQPLPSSVQHCLDRLHRRALLGRTLKGVSLLLGTTALALLLCLGLDHWFWLETPHLRAAFLCLIGVSCTILFFWVLLPWFRRTAPEALAARLEQSHPELMERITVLVHLQRASDPTHGSPDFQASVRKQTEDACVHLDASTVYPLKGPARGAIAAVLLFAVTFLASALAGQDFLQRLATSFATPWHGYTLRVTPGEHAFVAGQPVRIQVEVAARHSRARLPGECFVVVRKQNGAESRYAMLGAKGGFACDLTDVEKGSTYFVDAGGLQSEAYSLHPVVPLRLIDRGFQAKISPPPYMNSEATITASPKAIRAIQYGALHLAILTDRAPSNGTVEWRNEDGEEIDLPVLQPLIWDGAKGQGTWLLPSTGKIVGSCALEAEHGLVFRHGLPAIEVRHDAPPRLSLSLSDYEGIKDGAIRVPPGDTLLIQLHAEDQEGLGKLYWELQINDEKPLSFFVKDHGGKTSLEETVIVALPSEAKTNDRIGLRFHVEDNRVLAQGCLLPDGSIPKTVVRPNVSTQSLDLVVKDTESLRMREVLAKRDEIDAALNDLAKKVESLRADVGNLRGATHAQPLLRPDQRNRLKALKEKNQDHRFELMVLSESLKDDGVDPLALKLEELARQELATSEAAMQDAAKADASSRDANLHRSEDQLMQAVRKLQSLRKLNAQLAQDRLDRQELRILADKEERLAGKLDSTDKAGLKSIDAEQDAIRKKLESLIESSPLLGGILKNMGKDRAEAAMKGLEELARNAREPALDTESLGKDELNALVQLAKEQTELATRVETWQKDTEKSRPVDQPRKAADAMRQSHWAEALGYQKQAEEALRLRADLIETGNRLDLRGRVLHLAKMQESITRDLMRLGEDFSRLKDEEQMQRIKAIQKTQVGLEKELGGLKVPEKASASHVETRLRLEEIVTLQNRGDFLGAFYKMEEAARLLEGLAGHLPEGGGLDTKSHPDSPEHRESIKLARKLGEDQTDLRHRLEKILAQAARLGAKNREAQAQAGSEKAAALADELLKLSQQMGDAKGKAKMEAAAKMAAEASKLMQSSAKMPGTLGEEARKESSMKLEMASKTARDAMQGTSAKDDKEGLARKDPEAAKNIALGKRDLEQAGMELKKGDVAGAGKAMMRAVEAMKRAAAEPKSGKRSLASGKSGGKTPATGGMGPKTSAQVPTKDLERFVGKSWGELPGEVKAQLMLQMQQRFGEEYQPIIQRYFENLSREESKR